MCTTDDANRPNRGHQERRPTIGSFAESATYVRQRRAASDGSGLASELQFEVGTGELGPGARFLPHGHVVLINVVGIM